MGIAKLHLVLVEEVFGHGAFHGLSVLQLQRETADKNKWYVNGCHQHDARIKLTIAFVLVDE